MIEQCKSCKNKEIINGIIGCVYMDADCQNGEKYESEIITNADRIRAMSDEELAHELALIAGWDRKQYEKAKRIGIEKVMLDWLRKEQGEHHEVD